jgi:hypothetical protein
MIFCQIFPTPGDTFKLPLYLAPKKFKSLIGGYPTFFSGPLNQNCLKFDGGSEIYPWLYYNFFYTVSLFFFFIQVNYSLFVRPAEPERPEGGRELCQRGDQPSIRGALTQGANQGE